MSEIDEPELHVVRLSPAYGAEFRARAEHQRSEARTRFVQHLTGVLDESAAMAAIDALTAWNDISTGERCGCSCHPRLSDGDLHGYGFECPCRQTPEARRRRWDEWLAETEAFWASPEGQLVTEAREAEERELADWLAHRSDIVVRSHGGMAPEQWWGEVDGRRFYFRERHDRWRIELDLRSSGRFSTVWVGGDFDDDGSFEEREIEIGDVIAEGTTTAEGYGQTPVERLRFIVDVIRKHLLRKTCTVHTDSRQALESLLGRPPAWCPSCGEPLPT